jgi:hypothetical protein
VGYWTGAPHADLLLEHSGGWKKVDSKLEDALPQSRWDWPEIHPLETSEVLSEGRSLWILTPRMVWWSSGAPLEPVDFADNRHATLVRFETGRRRGLSLPIRFEHADPSFDPFDASPEKLRNLYFRQIDGSRPMPLWAHTPEGLVFALPTIGGHWLLPRALLETRLQSLRNEPESGRAARTPEGGIP